MDNSILAGKVSYFVFILLGHLDAMLRNLVIGKMGSNGHEDTITEANKRFEAHCAGTKVLPADVRRAVSWQGLVNSVTHV